MDHDKVSNKEDHSNEAKVIKNTTLTKGQSTKKRGIYLLPNSLTTGALFAGFYAVIAAMNGQFEVPL